MVLATTGPRRVEHATHKNVGQSERAISAALGGLFVAGAVKRRGASGLALALIGAELVRRGATGHCMLYDAIGFSSNGDGAANGNDRTRADLRSAAATVNARKSIKVERSVTIAKPAQDLYDFWRTFSNLAGVLDDLDSVTDLGNGRSHWVAKAAGTTL